MIWRTSSPGWMCCMCCCVTAGSTLRTALETSESRLAADQRSLPNPVQMYLLYHPHWQETNLHLDSFLLWKRRWLLKRLRRAWIIHTTPPPTETRGTRRFTTRRMKTEGKHSIRRAATNVYCHRWWICRLFSWLMWISVSQSPRWRPPMSCFFHNSKIFSLLSQR